MTEWEEFEKRFPVPKGIEWINDTQGYRITSDDDYWWDTEGQAHFRGYLGHWIGWQAAREQEGESQWLVQLRGDYLATRGIWERPSHCGYTNDIHEAGRFSEEDANKSEAMAPHKYKAVRLPAPHPPQPQGVPEGQIVDCPYACGWQNLQSIITRNAAYFARETIDDDFPEEIRQSGIASGQYALELCRFARRLSTPAAPQADEWVKCAEMDDELRRILGRPNFACVGIAERLRELGQDIERKAESEQAAAIHWMMSLYVQHGADWLKKGNALLEDRPQPPEQGDE